MKPPEEPPSSAGSGSSSGSRTRSGTRSIRRMGKLSAEGEGLSYGSYLRIPELLSLQSLLSDPPAHDELLFIVVHQAYELWFKELLFEVETVRDRMYAREPEAACFARTIALRIGAITTMVTSRTRSVTAAAAPSTGKGSRLSYRTRSSSPTLANGPRSARRAQSTSSLPSVPGTAFGRPTPTSTPRRLPHYPMKS